MNGFIYYHLNDNTLAGNNMKKFIVYAGLKNA